MGKVKRQKQKPHKENPTGLMSVKDFDENEDYVNMGREQILQKIYEEIQSSAIEEKLCGLQTLESMCYSTSLAAQIAADGIAKIAGPLLVDHNVSVRAAAASTLTHVAENGGEKGNTCLFHDDIMTPLSALLKKEYEEWQSKYDNTDKQRIRDEKEAFIQAVTLLWTLCENNELAIKYANEEDLLSILLHFLNIATFGIEMGTVAAQCILSLSEDNPVALRKLQQFESEFVDLLNLNVTSDMTSSDAFLLKALMGGLLTNISNYVESDQTAVTCQVLRTMSEILIVNHVDLLNDLVSILSNKKGEFSRDIKNKLQEIRKTLNAQQQALEILANLCSEDVENDSKFDVNDLDEAIETECDSGFVNDEQSENNFSKVKCSLPVMITEIIDKYNVIKNVWSKTISPDEIFCQNFSQSMEGKPILKQIHSLRCSAYLCLNNLISVLEIEALGGAENIYSMWNEIGRIVFGDANSSDIKLLESATSAMRAALQRLTEIQTNAFCNLTATDIQPMLNGERQCTNANIRANLIRILGNLALIVANRDVTNKFELVKHISVFLLDTCVVESIAWVMAECLDAIIDIYSEDKTDQLAADIQLTVKLQELIPIFKNKVQQQKSILGDNAAVVSIVNTNITRFIKYKERRLRSLK